MEKADFVKEAEAKYGKSFDYSQLPSSLKRRQLTTVICKKHGSFKIRPRDHLRSKHGCPRCGYEKMKCGNERINSRNVFKATCKFKNAFDYSQVKYDVPVKELQVIRCPDHGEFKMVLRNHYHSRHGCPNCAQLSGIDKRAKYHNLNDYVDRLNSIHGNRYQYLDYNMKSTCLTYRCPLHGIIKQ